jgi:hypothetical protein
MLNRFPALVVALLISFAFGYGDVAAQGRYAQSHATPQGPGLDSPPKVMYSKFTDKDAENFVLSDKVEKMIDELCNEYPLIYAINPRISKTPEEYILRMDELGRFDAIHMCNETMNNPENISINNKRGYLLSALRDEIGRDLFPKEDDHNKAFDILWKRRVVKPWEAGYIKAVAKQRATLRPPEEGEWKGVPKVIGVYCEADGKIRLFEVLDKKGRTVPVDSKKSGISLSEYSDKYSYALVRGMMKRLNEQKRNPILVVQGKAHDFKKTWTFLEIGGDGIFRDISERKFITELWSEVDKRISEEERVSRGHGKDPGFVIVNSTDDFVTEIKADGRHVTFDHPDFDHKKWMKLIEPAIRGTDLDK